MNCGCYSVNASDISPVLILLDARIVTTKKTVRAADFFTTRLKAADMLDTDELVTAVRFRVPRSDGSGGSVGRHHDRDVRAGISENGASF